MGRASTCRPLESPTAGPQPLQMASGPVDRARRPCLQQHTRSRMTNAKGAGRPFLGRGWRGGRHSGRRRRPSENPRTFNTTDARRHASCFAPSRILTLACPSCPTVQYTNTGTHTMEINGPGEEGARPRLGPLAGLVIDTAPPPPQVAAGSGQHHTHLVGGAGAGGSSTSGGARGARSSHSPFSPAISPMGTPRELLNQHQGPLPYGGDEDLEKAIHAAMRNKDTQAWKLLIKARTVKNNLTRGAAVRWPHLFVEGGLFDRVIGALGLTLPAFVQKHTRRHRARRPPRKSCGPRWPGWGGPRTR